MLMIMYMIVASFLNDVMEESYLKIQLSGKTQLRHQAYNAFNCVICQLEQSLNGSERIVFPKEGKQEIKLKGADTVKAYVQLSDESGKFPLNKANLGQRDLKSMFCLFGDVWDGQLLTQVYLNWLKRKPVECQLIEQNNWSSIVKKAATAKNGTGTATKDSDQDKKQGEQQSKLYFIRDLNDYEQLREINKFREIFFDEKGIPNKKMAQLKECSSLYNVGTININSVNKDTLEALSKNFSLDLDQMENYLGLSEGHESDPKYYKSLKEINDLGHGNLSFKTKTDRDMQQVDCRKTLSVDPNVVQINITAEEVDSSFSLKVIVECGKQSLTKNEKNSSIKTCNVQIKALVENYL